MNSYIDTPVLLVVFNRPYTTIHVFDMLRKVKPAKLYVSCDGPRENNDNDKIKINEVRDIVSSVDWECQVKFIFREYNLGCGAGVKSSIDWFFDNEEKGIILEDDTVPTLGFFRYCHELLEMYKHDERIAMISGTNHLAYNPKGSSYLFSKNKACWGWATWKRAWKNMDFEMNWRSGSHGTDVMYNMGCTGIALKHWKKSLELIDSKSVSAWDWQWYFSVAAQNQLTIFPGTNLVSNIGFGNLATHTFGTPRVEYLKTKDISFPILHPSIVCPDRDFDICFEKFNMKKNVRIAMLFPKWFKDYIKFFINKCKG